MIKMGALELKNRQIGKPYCFKHWANFTSKDIKSGKMHVLTNKVNHDETLSGVTPNDGKLLLYDDLHDTRKPG